VIDCFGGRQVMHRSFKPYPCGGSTRPKHCVIYILAEGANMSKCRYCDKDMGENPDRSKGNRRTQCGSCSVSKRRWKVKYDLVAAKGGKCSRCGWDKHPAALQFHHTDPSIKEFNLNANTLLREKGNYEEELSKCILLCANCHAVEHQNGDRFLLELGWKNTAR
jgi:hypothetical protein